MRIIRPCQVVFADEKIEKEFNELSDSNEIKKWINRAIDNSGNWATFCSEFSICIILKNEILINRIIHKEDIKKNAFCGIQFPKRLIPQIYAQKYKITNLWKYDLPDGWRLIYSLTTPNKAEIVSIILEWFNHPDYERRFNY